MKKYLLMLVLLMATAFTSQAQKAEIYFGYGGYTQMDLSLIHICFCSLIIGKVFSAYALGCYSNARLIVSFSSENLSNIVTRAIFPSFCRLQNSPEMLCMAVKDYMRISFLVIAPLMLGLAAVAEPIVHVMIGWQWLYASYLLRILCVGLMFYPLININMMVLKILGFGKRYLLLQILSIVVGLGCLVAMIRCV